MDEQHDGTKVTTFGGNVWVQAEPGRSAGHRDSRFDRVNVYASAGGTTVMLDFEPQGAIDLATAILREHNLLVTGTG